MPHHAHLALLCAALLLLTTACTQESQRPTNVDNAPNNAAQQPDADGMDAEPPEDVSDAADEPGDALDEDPDTAEVEDTDDFQELPGDEPDDAGPADADAPDAPMTDADQAEDADAPDTNAPDGADTDADEPAPCTAPTEHTAPPLIQLNDCGQISYGLYANRGEDQPAVNRMPDFSFAGYKGGGVPIPNVPVVLELDQPSGQDDRQRIQDALDQIAGMEPGPDGFRGALLLSSGQWRVDGTLNITASGVVLRGEGQGQDGTTIVATEREQHDLIVLQGQGQGPGSRQNQRQPITDARVPVGARRFTVADAQGFAPGDVIGVERTPNDAWIEALGMDQWGWTASSYAIAHERRVVAVEGNTITIDVPLVDTMEEAFGGGAIFKADYSGRIEQVGVEDLRLVSEFDGPEDEDHGWKAVRLHRVLNGWVQRVTAQHFGYAAVSVERDSNFNTVQEVAMLEPISRVTGGRRYSFNVSQSTGTLFQRCYAEQGRHDFVSGSRTSGPNVWLDSHSTQSSNDAGPHHRWATGLLFDNVVTAELHVENRADSGSGHGWSGAQTLFWNATAKEIISDAPIGAMNWVVGTAGQEAEGGWVPEEPDGWRASLGDPLNPRSLYLQQLQDRLGADAVRAVTTEAQRNGRIWGQLAAWAGEGRLSDAVQTNADPLCDGGIASSGVCCDAACGQCGGQGCGGRPGGSSACCTGVIKRSGVDCSFAQAPCILSPEFAPQGE